MNLQNYINYGMCIYENTISQNDAFKLGDVVINEYDEIGVIIQVHSPNEFRTDMFGNTSSSEVRLAESILINKLRPNLHKEGRFKHKALKQF